MRMPTHRDVDRVITALLGAGADPARVTRLRILPDAVTTAPAAAEALGVGHPDRSRTR